MLKAVQEVILESVKIRQGSGRDARVAGRCERARRRLTGSEVAGGEVAG